MSIIQIVEQDHVLVVDSRLIATDLEIQHESFRKLLEDYQVKLEAKFGVFRFEIGKPPKGSRGGRPEKFYWLTELQSTAMLTLVSNTDRAVDLKLDLVEKFDAAKKLLSQAIVSQPQLEQKKQRSMYELTVVDLERIEFANQLDNDRDREFVLASVEPEFWGMPQEIINRLKCLLSIDFATETLELRSKLQAKHMSEQCKVKQKGFGGPSQKEMYHLIFADCQKENLQGLETLQDCVNDIVLIKACGEFEKVVAARRIEATKQALLAG